MFQTLLSRIGAMLFLVLLQALLLNNVLLFHSAAPYLILFFLMHLKSDMSPNALMLWGFVSGLLVDMLSSTPGVFAAASVAYGCVRPNLLKLCTSFEENEAFIPSFREMGRTAYWKYLVFSVLLFVAILLGVGQFGQFSLLIYLRDVFASSVFTIILLASARLLFRSKA